MNTIPDKINQATLTQIIPQDALSIIGLLEECEIEHWIDSGTLLGIVREGKPIEGDNDIDLGAYVDDEAKLVGFLRAIKSSRLKKELWFWKEKLFKLKIYPRTGDSNTREIDINFFRKLGDNLLCPATHGYSIYRNLMNAPFYKAIAYSIVRWCLYESKIVRDISKTYIQKALQMDVWIIQQKMVLPTVLSNTSLIRFPHDTFAYLNQRYGDWSTPRPDWNFMIEDPCYIQNYNDAHKVWQRLFR